MNNDYDEIEEELKEEESLKEKTHKISGRSVFKLQQIIKKKGEDNGRDDKDKSD